MPKTTISIQCFTTGVVEALRVYSRYIAGGATWGWGTAAAEHFLQDELGFPQSPQVPLEQHEYEAFARIAKYNDSASTATNHKLAKLVKAIQIANDWLENSCDVTLDETMAGTPPSQASLTEVVTSYQANFDSAARALDPVPPVYSPPPSSYWDPVYSGPPSALATPEYSPPPSVLSEIPPELATKLPTEDDFNQVTGETFR